ncbi:Mu transposase C-terminal domain-containing protein [Massilia sp. CCM 9210]|uniref:Mu transposase C-terminal domain-containing protein n=1 Tax=Massilia scottii TaxID=3057166 RepID=UPI0027967358|nr:Mu transposase C-terminal domain-containing protein [Massilia sp. CCM 9210]MDQ1812861.1 Mu transposase C-terminal domain-containing protein [Massilia sp. CCM 9210]
MTETAIEPGVVIAGTSADSPLPGLHRVLEIVPHLDQVTLIPIPVTAREMPGKKQKSYYAKGFFLEKLSQLRFWLETSAVKRSELILPNHWYLGDEDLRRLWPPADAPDTAPEDRDRSPVEVRRNRKWKLIEPLIPVVAGTGTRPPDLTCLHALVRERARMTNVSAGQIFDALHRYYAFGCIKNALMPNNVGRSGAPGIPRRGKNQVKLGRKNALVKAGDSEKAGLILTDADVLNIQDAYMAFVRPGTTISQAFLSMSAAYYSTGYEHKHGYAAPLLLDAHLRPTYINFTYHGPRATDANAAARRLMGEGEWMRDYRLLVGTARDGIPAIGQVGSLDASPVDVNFVACGNPLQPIGVGRGLFVRDAWLGLYLGWHIGMAGLGTDDAKMAILRAATDKAAILARYGLDLPPEDFPSLFFSKYLSDNGELRSRDGIDTIVDELTSRIEFVASGRADRNSPSESGHHERHRGFDHHLTGSTKGRQAKRGEQPAIRKALISRFTYTRLLLLWIHWANTKQELALHMVPTEMRREFAAQGKVAPRTRIGIYRWARLNGYVAGKPVDPTYLRAHLLPRFTATVQRGGLVLHRPNTGNAVELLHGARFNHEYLAHSGLIRDAIASGNIHIEVRADPDDLSQIILMDKQGTHVIPNIKDDAILIIEGGIADLCGLNDAGLIDGLASASQRDQDGVDQQAFRQGAEAEAKEQQRLARALLGDKKAPSAKAANVRAAQVQEKRDQLDDAARRAADHGAPFPSPAPQPATAPPVAVAAPVLANPASSASPRLTEIRKNRLAIFNSERKF